MILLGIASTLVVCALALWKGGPPERAVAVASLFAMTTSVFGQAVLGSANAWPVVVADFALGFGLFACAVLYTQRWIYIEVVLSAGLLLAHAFLLDGEATVTPTYRVIVDGINAIMLVILAWAGWRSWSRVHA